MLPRNATPEAESQKTKIKERKKELTKKERKLQYSLFDIFETSQLARKITRYAIYDEATMGNINPFVLLQAHRNAHLVVTEAESRGDHKGTSGHLERLLPGTSRRANPLARAGCRILLEGRLPNAGCEWLLALRACLDWLLRLANGKGGLRSLRYSIWPVLPHLDRILSSRRAFWRFRFHFSNSFPFIFLF